MKTMLLTCLLFLTFNSFAEDTALLRRVTQLETSLATMQTNLTSNQNILKEINVKLGPATPSIQQKASTEQTVAAPLSIWQKLYVLLPIILFLVLFFVLISWLRRGGFNLADALLGDSPVQVEQTNQALPAAAAAAAAAAITAAAAVSPAVPPPAGTVPVTQVVVPSNVPSTVSVSQLDANGNPVMPKSSSRFIALFSGIAAIIIALCMISYYTYFSIRGGKAPDFSNVFESVLALGIGVVPYAVNKFTQRS